MSQYILTYSFIILLVLDFCNQYEFFEQNGVGKNKHKNYKIILFYPIKVVFQSSILKIKKLKILLNQEDIIWEGILKYLYL